METHLSRGCHGQCCQKKSKIKYHELKSFFNKVLPSANTCKHWKSREIIYCQFLAAAWTQSAPDLPYCTTAEGLAQHLDSQNFFGFYPYLAEKCSKNSKSARSPAQCISGPGLGKMQVEGVVLTQN